MPYTTAPTSSSATNNTIPFVCDGCGNTVMAPENTPPNRCKRCGGYYMAEPAKPMKENYTMNIVRHIQEKDYVSAHEQLAKVLEDKMREVIVREYKNVGQEFFNPATSKSRE